MVMAWRTMPEDPRPVLAVFVGGAGCAVALIIRWLRKKRIREKIEKTRRGRERALLRMEASADRLARQHPVDDPAAILDLPLAELLEKLQSGEVTPEMVLSTYMGQALEVTRQVNCITDYLPECEAQLVQLQNETVRGPLYGVPISLKDNYDYKGHDTTLGLKKNLDQPAGDDAIIVQVLKKQGAVPFVKTNVPQSMLNYDCSNPIFGQTLNPLNYKKTPGGSSGGEGALIAGRGSILGFGSDIGGSIRFPSAFCGVCGFKPTGNRISKVGVQSSSPGQRAVTAMVGPIARDVESLVIAMRALLCDEMFQLDPTVPPIPFNEKVFSGTGPLRIGYYETDDSTMATPSMRRAVVQTKQLLERAGHQLVSFTPPAVEKALFDLVMKGLLADGGSTFLDNLSVKDLWKLHQAVEAYRKEFISCWRNEKLDALICPILGPALGIGYPGKLSTAASYTILYNLVDCPVGVLPVTAVTREDEEALRSYRGHHHDFWDKLLNKALADGVGLPVAVQCVALPWQEEQCLRLMKEVESVTRMRADKSH
ncbi:fatty-acid amide hydrolase 1-like [Pyxicephalus adspersus]|uniref:fatty-acid amide hydrolase 1-like n=1 Tax=Pyxicephalus adspersus TaxID=30357 RepID=UPI003B5C096D